MIERIKELLLFGEDSADEKEVIEVIKNGVTFRGAKLWILVIAVFVASLGLNTNSAAVIIGAMLISPLMGPIIGMGLGVGIYDFDLLRRSWRNYIIATIFSVLTATVYFLITPLAEAQSELLARTSPTIYDVFIAICGGLAGIIALSSRSQRTGNAIPGVAIATALMPPLCTVGFGIATANWSYAAGALYLFLINTIFIAGSTFVGAVFIMKFKKTAFIDPNREKSVKRMIISVALVTIIPSVLLTIGMVRENYFEQRVNRFIQHELHFPMTQVVSHRSDFDSHSFSVVLIGNELDSTTIQIARARLPFYKLDDVDMQVIQGKNGSESDEFRELLLADSKELHQAEGIIAQQQVRIGELETDLKSFTDAMQLAPQLLRELKVLYPTVMSITAARGSSAAEAEMKEVTIALVVVDGSMQYDEQERLTLWLKQRTNDPDLHVIYESVSL
ncbi:MAG: TIGR00341 family protein [Bacteroidales bacterium]|nr:TIGR00341 family protein [Candidatus Liminaster caballi]